MKKAITVSIDITVATDHVHGNSLHYAPLIAAAVEELAHRHDFKSGGTPIGTAITHEYDHGAIRVSVDVSRWHHHEGTTDAKRVWKTPDPIPVTSITTEKQDAN